MCMYLSTVEKKGSINTPRKSVDHAGLVVADVTASTSTSKQTTTNDAQEATTSLAALLVVYKTKP